jgi:nitrite reductase/ring-hydroxylating ferredoxin subunit
MTQKEHDTRLIARLSDYPEDGIYEIPADEKSYLLVIQNGKPHLLENKCGHFGVSMAKGYLEDQSIVCPEHGISFDLNTGQVVNRPFENCDPIKVVPVKVIDDDIFLQRFG